MPAFMNDDEQRAAHYQIRRARIKNVSMFIIYKLLITNYLLRILPAHKLGSDASCFFVRL